MNTTILSEYTWTLFLEIEMNNTWVIDNIIINNFNFLIDIVNFLFPYVLNNFIFIAKRKGKGSPSIIEEAQFI